MNSFFVPIANPIAAMRTVRRHRVDILIDCGQWARIGALLSIAAGRNFTVGFRTPGQHRHFLYDAYAVHRDDQQVRAGEFP